MTDKDLIAGMWAIAVKHHKANTTPSQMVDLLAFVRENDTGAINALKAELTAELTAERERAEKERTRNAALQQRLDAFYSGNPKGGIVQRLEAERDELRERVARLEEAIACAKDLATIMRMPNVEYVADAHNAAVAKLRTALEGK